MTEHEKAMLKGYNERDVRTLTIDDIVYYITLLRLQANEAQELIQRLTK